jgi:hypothetical protein
MTKLTLDSIRALQTQGTNALGRLRNGIDELRNGNFPNFGGDSFSNTSKDKAKFSVNAFMGQLAGRDLALTTHYMVTVNHPLGQQLSFAACGTTLPGFTVNTMEVRRYGVGPTTSTPVTSVNPDLTINFYIDAKGDILFFFQDWAVNVFNTIVDDSPDSGPHYVSRYKSEYALDIDITLYNREKDAYGNYRMRKAFPILIGNAELAWGDSQILRLPVTFKYDNYVFEQVSQTQDKSLRERGGFLNDIRQAFTEAGDLYDMGRSIYDSVERTRNQIGSIVGSNIGGNISFGRFFPGG